jgi:hypothetical protein
MDCPMRPLKAFWPVLGPLLVDSCNEAFPSETEEGVQLTKSQAGT